MAKLYKEAGRVMQVLSANTEHYAQVEGLLEDQDFKAKVSREEIEEMNKDLFQRIGKVAQEAFESSEITKDEIVEVILMGGGTRIPKVKEVLQAAVGREELGKSINTDEAAALGAVYQAAYLSKGFRVKKFNVKDANLFPIVVEFEKVRGSDADPPKVVKRVLFGRNNPFPQKKVMTFNKHTKDFSFNVGYGDLTFMSEEEQKMFGSSHLTKSRILGNENAHTKHTGEAEAKGVKAHFRMDESGILSIEKVEALFEKAPAPEAEADQSTLSKLGNTISNLFGGGEKSEETEATLEKGEDEGEEVKKEEVKPEGEKKEETGSTDKKDGEKKDDKQEEKKTEEKKEEKEKKPKIQIMKEVLEVETEILDIQDPTKNQIQDSKEKIENLRVRDIEKRKLEKAKNELESFIVEAQDRLYQTEYEKCSKEEERVDMQSKLSLASDWLYEQEDSTPRKDYEAKIADLKALTKDLYSRVKELKERPEAIKALNGMINYTEHFLVGMVNYTGEDQPFTEVEQKTLQKLIEDTKEWNKTVMAEQANTPLYEKPRVTIEDVARKLAELDREVKYLVNKARTFRPKPKPKPEETEGSKNSTKKSKKPKKPKKPTNSTKPDDEDSAIEVEDEEYEVPVETKEQKQDAEKTSDQKKTDEKEGIDLNISPPPGEEEATKKKPKQKRGEEQKSEDADPLQLDGNTENTGSKDSSKTEEKSNGKKDSTHNPDDEL